MTFLRKIWVACTLRFCLGFILLLLASFGHRTREAINLKQASAQTRSPISTSVKGRINGKIVFTSNRNRSLSSRGLRLWTMNPDGSNPTELTNLQIPVAPISLPPDDTNGKWSPDGTKIAFLTDRDYDPNANDYLPTISIMDADGSNFRHLDLSALRDAAPLKCELDIDSFEWSPDGTKFVISDGQLFTGLCPSGGQSAELYTINTNGTHLVRLTYDTTNDRYVMNVSPSWSADGRQIAFNSWDQNGHGAIDVMNADGTNRYSILNLDLRSRSTAKPLWSPDGSKILFVLEGESGSCENYVCEDLYVVNPDGSQVKQLTHYLASYAPYRGPRWSPDGKQIVFGRQLSDPNTHQLTSDYAIFVMNADGTNQINISNRESNLHPMDAEPDWQPLLAPANEPPPSVVGFDTGIYLAAYPNPPSVQINVVRTGNVNQTISCDYQTWSGTVKTNPSGTLTFAPGETTKTINLSSVYLSTLNTFKMDLFNNAGNATFIGGLKHATVILASQYGNPIDNSAFFVRQHYRDFLSREPESSGWDFWTNNIDSCGTKLACLETLRVNTSAAFFLSIEFQQTGYLVYRTYKAAYGNISGAPVPIRFSEFMPDTQQIGQGVIVGQSGWDQTLETNKQNFMNSFVQRSRFTSAYPTTMSAQQFVDTLYTNAGIVPMSAPNRAQAISEFNSTTPADPTARARALRDVAEDPMLTQQEFNRAFVLMQYFGYLRRDPNSAPDTDFTGYNFWLTKMNQFNGNYIDAEMVKAFITSSEYRSRFGTP